MASKKNIQLIVATHESRLLDFDLLCLDEIWFVNKRKNVGSDICSLEEYNARFDQKQAWPISVSIWEIKNCRCPVRPLSVCEQPQFGIAKPIGICYDVYYRLILFIWRMEGVK